ncbi:hypothetical protein F8M41_015986 [Gigaspora margarita]|uniref:Uncharacterized protein n=1 Tax=Gigaspora margarita TaxID=4874 RepID=A0A8H4EUV9_GIGMA|nr:hypothetical protein F8M41_015986 [Gigaspora margarita]
MRNASGYYYTSSITIAQNNDREVKVEEVDHKNQEKAEKNKNELYKIELNDANRAGINSKKTKSVKKDLDQYNPFERKDLLMKDLDEACMLWMKKVNELKNKILEVEPMNARALVNKENKKKKINKNPSLTYLNKNKKEALADVKSDFNEDKCLKAKNLKGLKDN